MTNRFGHTLLQRVVRGGHCQFHRASTSLETVQRQRLSQILGQAAAVAGRRRETLSPDWSWEEFSRRQPVTDYDSWRVLIEEQRTRRQALLTGSPVMRYQPTSGSTSAIKWIPYTRQFLHELDCAIAPWLGDLYRRYPRIRQGCHYWSLSWVPTEMRQHLRGHINDDMKLLSGGKRWLAARTQAVPDAVSLAGSSDDSMFATLAYLVARRDLSTLSIWSPTFGLGLLEKLGQWRELLREVLGTGKWGDRQRSLGHMKAPRSTAGAALLRDWDGTSSAAFYRALWPQLALVSAWDTAGAAPWARRLQGLLPQADFQGKGLWATEGVVTIPQGEHHVLAGRSHVYEFEDAGSGQILPPWQLERGQEVVPLITTGSGLLRYRMNDRLRVEGFCNQLPCLGFLGRNDGVDMVGEKISAVLVQSLLEGLDWPGGVCPVTVLAAEQGGVDRRPAYVLLAEAPQGQPQDQYQRWSRELAGQLEQALGEHFHYKLARGLQQLDPARCLCMPGAGQQYLRSCRERGMIEGNIKVESLRAWSGPLPAPAPGQPQPVGCEEVS